MLVKRSGQLSKRHLVIESLAEDFLFLGQEEVPLDFFFWAYVKSKVYTETFSNLNQLRAKIKSVINKMDQAILRKIDLDQFLKNKAIKSSDYDLVLIGHICATHSTLICLFKCFE